MQLPGGLEPGLVLKDAPRENLTRLRNLTEDCGWLTDPAVTAQRACRRRAGR